MRVLIVSHGHPELSAGGAERAAYSLFLRLKHAPGVVPTFVARGKPLDIGHDGWFGAFRGRKDEFLWVPPAFDWFRCSSLRYDRLFEQIETIVEQFKPSITHMHHYFSIGVDAFQLFKEISGKPIAVTLHEYGLICNHNGQMVKKGSLHLCHAASPAECATCFPEFSSGKFFLRERAIKQQIAFVDAFVSPSEFLRARYVAWGIREDKLYVIENVLPRWFEGLENTTNADKSSKLTRRIRFGYFGQLNPYKGAMVLLDALQHLSAETLPRIEVVVFGAHLDQQPTEFRDAFTKRIDELRGIVSFAGPYRNEDVPALMRSVHWMVIPSIWWENSPLVIQEAKAMGVPILASNIGGMAEKVRDGVDGLHFIAGSAMDCASKIESILAGTVSVPRSPLDVAAQNSSSVARHIQLYRDATAQQTSKVEPTDVVVP